MDAAGMIVIPGLVDCHVHTVQTLFRGICDNLGLLPWLQKYIYPMESAMDSEDVYTSSLAGYAEMIKSGTTTCADMQSVRHTDSAFEAAGKIGIRSLIAKSMMDQDSIPESLQEDTSTSIAESMKLYRKWHRAEDGRLRCMLGPRFLQGCSEKLLGEVAQISNQTGMSVHIHAAENSTEVKNDIEKYGKRTVEKLHDLGLVGAKSLLVHCVHLSDREIGLIAEENANVVHCPSSNLKLASGICPVPRLMQSQVNVTVGVDGAACNDNLDMFKDMKLASLVSKISGQPQVQVSSVSAMNILEMATVNGARALGMQDEIGSIEKGKKADLTILNMRNIETTPMLDVLNQIIYSTDGHAVKTVIIDGKIVMENRHLTTVDEDALVQKAQSRAEKIVEKAGVGKKS
jgi:cytosine/adenosine deaminase-related metal-dependent hydrolase